MNKKFCGLVVFVFLLFGAFAFAAESLIEKGDLLKVYIIDNNGSDLIAGSFSQTTPFQRDPHEIEVSGEGRIFVPHVGILQVQGRSAYEVETEIKKRIQGTIRYSYVAVLLSTTKFSSVYVLGEVNSPGMYKIDRSRDFEMRIMNAVNLAGGFSDRADLDNVTIVSRTGQKKTVNLRDIIMERSVSNNVILQDQDSIIVGQGVSRVYVLGEVNDPGGQPFLHGATFSDYIAEAGGMTRAAEGGGIGIIRKHPVTGKASIYKMPLEGTYLPGSSRDFFLRPGDIVYVPRSILADWKDIATILGMAVDYVYIWDKVEFAQ